MKIQYKLLSSSGREPTRAHQWDAGWDLYAAEPLALARGDYRLVSTGLAVNIPAGYYGMIVDRSGKSQYYKVTAGIIDAGYTGEIKVAVIGIANVYTINAGDKIAQLLIMIRQEVEWRQISEFGRTDRGNKGFGSSGG